MTEKSPPRKPMNVKKKKSATGIPVSDEPPKFKADVMLYFILNWLISAPIFLPLSILVMNNYFLKWYEQFFAIIGISVISDIISGYLASFPVAKAVSKYYNASYFISWYSQRTSNIFRNLLNWVFSAAFYVGGIIYFASVSLFGRVDLTTYIITYFIVKIVAFGISFLVSDQLMRVAIGNRE